MGRTMNCCTYKFMVFTLSILMLQYCDLVQSFSDENIASSVSRECKKLTECELYTNLLELQKRKVIRIGQELITEELKNQDCGWEDDMEPQVECPSNDEDDTTRSGSTASLLSSDEKCDGTIILKHSSAESLGDYQKLYLSEKDQYRNIRKKFDFLKENHVHGLRAEGDCCWELFPRPKYQGKKTQTISPGKETLPEFQPISLKKM